MGRDQETHRGRRNLRSSPSSPVATYQSRICHYGSMERIDGDAALSAYADLYGRVERKLFAAVAAGKRATTLKSEYLKRFGIPARMFNSVRVSLEGQHQLGKRRRRPNPVQAVLRAEARGAA